MMKYKKAILLMLVVVISFSVGSNTKKSDNYFEISKNLDIFGKLYREVNTLYVDGVDPTKMMRTGIDAMLENLDPYTNFISESEIEDFKFMSTGQYGGIGAMVGKREDKIIVLEPYESYPADKAGLKAGDEIMMIGAEKVSESGKSVKDVRDLLRGEKGTPVKLTIKRIDEEELRIVSLERDRIKINNVPYYGMVNDHIGYISLTGFTQDAGKEVKEALESLKKDNTLTGVVLDLRGNPGGRLDEAVNVSNVFIEQGAKIVETRGKDPSSIRSHFAKRASTDTEIPLVVLVNGRSASASEIVSGSIQDVDRGVVVGQRSFGKGLVQNIRPLSYNTQLKVTTAKYYTPSGRCIQAIDYAHRDADGSVGKVPDSLKTSFKTANGRTVYDGGGVEPEIEVKRPEFNTITRALQSKGLIFDFATNFVANHEKIDGPRVFQINDAVYTEFVTYVEGQEFDYKTVADKEMDDLQKALEKEDYKEVMQPAIEALIKQLDEAKDTDLRRNRTEISRILREEIIQRYYYKEGVIEASFSSDEDIAAAVKVLDDSPRYNSLLKP